MSSNQQVADALLRQCNDTRANRMKRIVFLSNFASDLIDKRAKMRRLNIIRLMSEMRPQIDQIESQKEKEAPYFNVFDALGVTRKEVIHSRFLAYLFSPNEHHEQGVAFLNQLLWLLKLNEVPAGEAKKVCVSTEHCIGEMGRMDIVIRSPSWLIVIENKIDAGEGNEQLLRYGKWMNTQLRLEEKNRHLIFLTPTGQESVTSGNIPYRLLSHTDLAKRFSLLCKGKDFPETLRVVITHYISICNSIGGINMVKEDKELQELLTRPDNIKATLEIEQQAQLARKKVAKDFAENISKILQTQISSDEEISTKWKAFFRADSDGTVHVAIGTLCHSRKPNYKLFAEFIFTHGGKGRFGWCRPGWVDLAQPQETAVLSKKMILNGCIGEPEGWWVAFNYLRGERRGYILSEIDDIIDCSEDNRSADHPLASEIAKEMW